MDGAGVMSPAQLDSLNQLVLEHKKSTGREIAVVTVKSLGGRDIEGFANEMFRHYGVGDAQQNNGVLFLIAPSDRKMRIEVGYGNEGQLTDLKSSLIIREVVAPLFKAGDLPGGIRAGTEEIVKATTPMTAETASAAPVSKENEGSGAFLIFIILIGIGGAFFVIMAIREQPPLESTDRESLERIRADRLRMSRDLRELNEKNHQRA